MEKYRNALREEIKNRARIYYLIYRELSREVGKEKAVGILKRALYERGRGKGLQLVQKIGGADLRKLAHAFVEGKQEVDVFGHEVVRADDESAVLRLNACPLVEAWNDLGLSAEEKMLMCDIAYQVDFGKFETAGYRLRFDRRIADGHPSCDLIVRARTRSH